MNRGHLDNRLSIWLSVSQTATILLVGWIQYALQGEVGLGVPLFSLCVSNYFHEMWLQKRGALPRMPLDIRQFWWIALGFSTQMIAIYCILQPWREVSLVLNVLPLLWLGLGLMDWVLLVCTEQFIRHLWEVDASPDGKA